MQCNKHRPLQTISRYQRTNGPIPIIGKMADNRPIPIIGASLVVNLLIS